MNKVSERLLTQNPEVDNINVDGKELKETEEFCYLGSMVNSTGGTKYLIRTIGLARKAFSSLNKIWASRKTKLKIFWSNVKAVLLYGAEMWKVNKIYIKKIQTFLNKCLRIICKLFWPNRIRNVDLWAHTGKETIKKKSQEESGNG